MYLVLRPPWAGGGSAPPVDGGVAVAPKPDGGKPVRGKHPRGGGMRGQQAAPGTPNGGDIQPITDNGPSDEPDPFAADGRGVPTGGAAGGDGPPAAPVIHVGGGDLAMEVRGDAIALPPRTVDASSGRESRSLEQGEIEAGTSGQGGAIKQCVERAAANTDLRGTVTVQVLVDGSGRVTKVRVQAAKYLMDHGGYDCARRAASAMRFAAVGGFTIVTLPVTLN